MVNTSNALYVLAISKNKTSLTRNLWRIKVRLRLPPHLYSVITLPSKTHTAAVIPIDFECGTFLKFTQNS